MSAMQQAVRVLTNAGVCSQSLAWKAGQHLLTAQLIHSALRAADWKTFQRRQFQTVQQLHSGPVTTSQARNQPAWVLLSTACHCRCGAQLEPQTSYRRSELRCLVELDSPPRLPGPYKRIKRPADRPAQLFQPPSEVHDSCIACRKRMAYTQSRQHRRPWCCQRRMAWTCSCS